MLEQLRISDLPGAGKETDLALIHMKKENQFCLMNSFIGVLTIRYTATKPKRIDDTSAFRLFSMV